MSDFTPIIIPKEKKSKGKVLFRAGALLDIPNGDLITGKRGEKIVNGGVSRCTAVVGRGNMFKSTILYFMLLKVAARIGATYRTGVHVYDTEINIAIERLNEMARHLGYLNVEEFINDETNKFVITDKGAFTADAWMHLIRIYFSARENSKPVEYTALSNHGKPYKDLVPGILGIDSFTEFEPTITTDMLDNAKEEFGKELNMLATKQGGYKTIITSELSRRINSSNTYLFLTAHVGDATDYSGGFGAPPPKSLASLKATDKIKGVGTKFAFLTTTTWQTIKVKNMFRFEDKTTEYPEKPDSKHDAKDLNLVTMVILRSKHGETETVVQLVVSQRKGVLEDVTYYDFLRKDGGYGISGRGKVSMDLYPSCKFSRKTLRQTVKEDPKLLKALEWTCDLRQGLDEFAIDDIYMEPAELYQAMIDRGYDWEDFYCTRNWMAIDQYSKKLPPYCSVFDLLEFARGIKKPYWFTEKQKEKIK